MLLRMAWNMDDVIRGHGLPAVSRSLSCATVSYTTLRLRRTERTSRQ